MLANINNKETVNIEIQLQNQYNIERRILFYWARRYGRKLNKGEDYKKLNKTISIMFVDFEISNLYMFKDAHTKWTMKEKRNNDINFFNDIELHIVEMPKIFKYSETNDKLKNWIQFILYPESEEVRMSIKSDVALNKAYEKLEEISCDERLRRIEELKLKKIWDDNSIRNYNMEQEQKIKRMKRELEADTQELEVGKQELEVGKQELEVDRQQLKKKEQNLKEREQKLKEKDEKWRTIAVKLLSKGIEIEEVSDITGLTIEELKKL